MGDGYICKIPTLEEMEIKWDYEIAHSGNGKSNWMVWKGKAMENFQKGDSIPYYGLLHGKIICEATAMLHPGLVPNSEGLVGRHMAYLNGFRTMEEYQGKGYFSKLMQFMLHDLQQRGFTEVILGVEPKQEKNRQIYRNFGFTQYIKSATETYPDGTVIAVDYYRKR